MQGSFRNEDCPDCPSIVKLIYKFKIVKVLKVKLKFIFKNLQKFIIRNIYKKTITIKKKYNTNTFL